MAKARKSKNPLDAVIGSAEAAELLGTTVDYISRLCRTKKLRAKQIGREWVIDIASVKALQDRPPGPGRPRLRDQA
jgi:excisionase family DNA binding protein